MSSTAAPAKTNAASTSAAPAASTTTAAAAAADASSKTAPAAAAATKAGPDLSANGLAHNDAQLKDNKDFQALHAKFFAPAADAAVQAAAKAINAKGFKATVVADAKAAVDLVATLIPQKVSVGFGYSTTFNEIGLNDYFKGRTDLHNFREIAHAAEQKKDFPAAMAARFQGLSADFFLTSANAISAETGDILIADGTGTRAPGIMTAKKTILVVGANKIVANNAAALERLEKYVLAVESARLREVYKMPGSAINNLVWVRGANPYNPGQAHVIIIAGQSFGF